MCYGAAQYLGLLQVKTDGKGLLHRFTSRVFLTGSARRLGSLIMTSWRRKPWISGLSLLSGGSAYPRNWDYARFHAVHPFFGSFFYTDLSHVLSFLDIKSTYLLA